MIQVRAAPRATVPMMPSMIVARGARLVALAALLVALYGVSVTPAAQASAPRPTALAA